MSLNLRTSILALSLVTACGGAAATTSAPVSATSAATGGASGSVKFTKKLPTVGSVKVTREHNETKLEMDITVDGVAQHTTNATVETIERRIEVLAVGDDGAPTRLKVTYAKNHRDDSDKGLVPSPVEGKSYVVEGHGEKLPSAVADAGGHPAPAAERAVVGSDFKHLGRIDPSQRALPDRPLAVGDSMDDMARALFEDDKDDGLQEVQIHFAGASDVGGQATGVFDIQLSGKVAPNAPPVKMVGKFSLLVDGAREVSSDATAPIEITEHETKNGKDVRVVAHGTMHLHKETSYEGR